ncbi:hypothetical protein ACFSCW_09715 [Sphingomonas tabacisoli]|uniref:Uncharacterized protein n=1 Tax=Sphingomonas tabacisoli TaxID=2249466 RepID=A0ABW4I3N6_9SPHN
MTSSIHYEVRRSIYNHNGYGSRVRFVPIWLTLKSTAYANPLSFMEKIMSEEINHRIGAVWPSANINNRTRTGSMIICSRQNEAYIRWVKNVRPTFYGVGTLHQSIITPARCLDFVHLQSARPTSGRVIGDEVIFRDEYHRILIQLTKAIYGQTNWKRFKRLLPNAATIEGDGYGRGIHTRSRGSAPLPLSDQKQVKQGGSRFHLNLMFRPPESLSSEDFLAEAQKAWSNSPWTLDLQLGPVTGGCVAYSLKEGPESLIVECLSF